MSCHHLSRRALSVDSTVYSPMCSRTWSLLSCRRPWPLSYDPLDPSARRASVHCVLSILFISPTLGTSASMPDRSAPCTMLLKSSRIRPVSTRRFPHIPYSAWKPCLAAAIRLSTLPRVLPSAAMILPRYRARSTILPVTASWSRASRVFFDCSLASKVKQVLFLVSVAA